MNYLDLLKQNNTTKNTKGGEYYKTTWNANLDIFSGISRYNEEDYIINIFKNAIEEDKKLALANLLYILDIRQGKGERRIFKIMFKYLCDNEKELALEILKNISSLGRWDYVLVGLDTKIDKEVVDLVRTQLNEDVKSDNPSLLAKWLPSHRTHKKNSETAKKLIKKLELSEEAYRKTLSKLRKKIKLVEQNLSTKKYNIDFEKVPTKAMLKYKQAFHRHCEDSYTKYLEDVKNNKKKINTSGLYCYEIVQKIRKAYNMSDNEKTLYDNMWKNQQDFLKDCDKNIMVVADTSGSMTWPNDLPIVNSLGLAIYTAERNKGAFANTFITFSSNPILQEVKGKNIVDKLNNVKQINEDTNIDKVFELLLNTAVDNKVPQEEIPSHIIIISDMEFDSGCYSEHGTNFNGWKKNFEDKGYKLPKIVFWNVSAETFGFPTTKFDKDVIMVSGFNTSILKHILNLEDFNPLTIMIETLDKYLELIDID